MWREQIVAALKADGSCNECRGTGTVYGEQEYENKRFPCETCAGGGRDPEALLKAVQAVGHLLLELVEKKA